MQKSCCAARAPSARTANGLYRQIDYRFEKRVVSGSIQGGALGIRGRERGEFVVDCRKPQKRPNERARRIEPWSLLATLYARELVRQRPSAGAERPPITPPAKTTRAARSS